MFEIEFEVTGSSIGIDELNIFEKDIHKTLPCEFKEFYSANNGGIPLQYIYWNNDEIYIINHFFPLIHEIVRNMTVEKMYNELLKEERISSDYLPFAFEESGGLFFISLGNSNYGHIYFEDHELSSEKDFPNNLHFVCDNLSVFLSRLTDRHPE